MTIVDNKKAFHDFFIEERFDSFLLILVQTEIIGQRVQTGHLKIAELSASRTTTSAAAALRV